MVGEERGEGGRVLGMGESEGRSRYESKSVKVCVDNVRDGKEIDVH